MGIYHTSGEDLSHTGWGFITQVGIYHTSGDLAHRWGYITHYGGDLSQGRDLS